MAEDLWPFIKGNRIFAVIRTDTQEQAISAARACIEGGIKIIEITLTVPRALETVGKLSQERGLLVGAGTVTDKEKAGAAIDSGARFIVSPVIDLQVIQTCKERKVFVSAGALTPTKVLRAWREGSDIVKVFPVSGVGGPQYIRALKEPLPYIQLMPSGGVNLKNMIQYLEAGSTAVCVAEGLISREAVDSKSWTQIAEAAKMYIKELKEHL